MSSDVDAYIDNKILAILELLSQIEEDINVPKNIRTRVSNTIYCLKEEEHFDLRISKAIDELGVIADDINLPSYTRTQVWNIVSLLESNE